MRIGSICLPEGAALAPMAGVSDRSMRRLCHEMGAAFCVSEMMSAKGFLYAPRDCRATRELLALDPDEGPVGLQLFGREPELMAEAVCRLEDAGFAFFDVNMGCPAHKIVGNGEGSALMREPELAGRIVSAMARATKKPVTVKIRAGWDAGSVNAVELARRLEDCGAAMLTVHGRTREQQYQGQADWGIICRVRQSVSIPVVGNGDVRSAQDERRMREETGCDGCAVGRAAQGNPWIFREIACAYRGEAYCPPTPRERIETALRHARLLCGLKGERAAPLEMRKHLAWYMQGMRGCSRLRVQIQQVSTMEGMQELLYGYLKELEEETP